MPWKKVRLSGQRGYWALVDKNNEPIDLDENGNIRVYDAPDGKQVALGEQVKPAYITRERDDKFAAQERARQIDEHVNRNQGALADLFGNLISGGMAGEVTEGAGNLRQGNYVKGTAQVLSPLMFMSGPLGIMARTGIGTYNLANEDGVRKTWNLASQGQYGRATLSGLGDLLNAGMAAEGISHIPNFLENAATRYGQGAVQNWGRARTLSKAINQGVRETELPITRRTISVNRNNNPVLLQPDLVYTLYNEFGEPIGLTNVGGAVFGSGDKSHRMVDGVMSMRNAHKVSEDTYNAAVQDILEGGGKGLESGWSLMSPQKTLAVTKKFPHEVIGLEFGNPVRLLTGTTDRPIPARVKGNHYQEVKPLYEIVYNETTGDFERVPIKKIVNTEGLYNHPGAFLRNTVRENGGITVNGEGVLRRPYQKPESSDWMLLELKEPLMADKPKLSRGQFETLFNSGKIKKPEDLYKYMTTTLAGRIFKMASNVRKALGKFSSSNLHDKKDLLFYNAVLERSTQGLKGTKGTSTAIRKTLADEKAGTLEGQYDLYLNNEDALALEEIRERIAKDYGTQIQFNEFMGEKLASDNIPQAVAIAPIEVPGVGKVPLMQRYLYNARQRAEQLFPDLVRRGYMFVDPKTKMWMGSYTPKEGNFKPIDPAMFVLSFVKNIRNSSNRVPVFREYSRAGNGNLVLPIAWHGTPTGDANLLTLYAGPTDIKSIFATVSDGMPGSSNVKAAYQRGGTSIPFLFKRKSYNGRIYLEKSYHPLQGGGNKSTGYILEDGTPIGLLIDHFGGGKGGGTARYVYDVSDLANIPHNSAQPQTEYIFGMGTPEVKSLLNTGDYIPYFDEFGNPIEGVTPFNKRGGKITINNL